MPDWARLLVVLAISAGLLWAIVIYAMAHMLLHPPRMSDGKASWVLKRLSPGDLGLAFQEQSFAIRDQGTGRPMRVTGWWIPHAAAQGRCAVLIHGYADAKVGSIAWAPLLHGQGWNVFAVDLRGHGESDGTMTTGGDAERFDIAQVIDQIRAQRPGETGRMILFGVSMGAAVAAGVAQHRDDLAGVILDSPFSNFAHGAETHFELLGLPGKISQRVAVSLAQCLARADWEALRLPDLIGRTRCPVLLIHGEDDPFLRKEDAEKVKRALEQRVDGSAFVTVEDAAHLTAISSAPAAYRDTFVAFLDHVSRYTPSAA